MFFCVLVAELLFLSALIRANRGRLLRPRWIDLLRIHTQFLQGLLSALCIEFALAGKARERGGRDGLGIDLEVLAQVGAIVATSEAVRA